MHHPNWNSRVADEDIIHQGDVGPTNVLTVCGRAEFVSCVIKNSGGKFVFSASSPRLSGSFQRYRNKTAPAL